MEKDTKYVCRRRKVDNVYKVECTDENALNSEPEKMYCLFADESKSGGASGLGFGIQSGKQIPVLKCFPDGEFKKEIAKALHAKQKNIKIVDD